MSGKELYPFNQVHNSKNDSIKQQVKVMPGISPVEISVKLYNGSLTLRGQAWGRSDVHYSRRILAWSGWLDNCGTWRSLAPYFVQAGYYLVAIDPIGCGISDHRSKGTFYNDFEECIHMIKAADALGWKTNEPFILLGHSRGAHIGSITSCVFHSRISVCLFMDNNLAIFGCQAWNIEGTKPEEKFQSGKGTFMGSLRELLNQRGRRSTATTKLLPSVDHAVRGYQNDEFFKKTWETSYNIVTRNLAAVFNKEKRRTEFQLLHDPQTYGQNQSHMIHPSACEAIFKNSSASYLLVCEDNSPWAYMDDPEEFHKHMGLYGSHFPLKIAMQFMEERKRYVAALKDVTIKLVSGSHHVHSDRPEVVAPEILAYLNSKLEDALKMKEAACMVDMRMNVFKDYEMLLMLPDIELKDHFSSIDVTKSAGSERVFKFYGRKFTTLVFGDLENAPANKRILCVHDDQDNAASFEGLGAEVIKHGFCLVAVDRQGRAGSSRVDQFQYYDPCDEPATFYDIADHLRWDKFNLISHGRGAVVASMVAAAFPERIISLTYISALTPTSEKLSLPNEMIVSEMFFSHMETRCPLEKFYRSPLCDKLVHNRNILFNYIRDSRLDVRPPLCFTEETCKRTANRITCPVLVIGPVNNQTNTIKDFISHSKHQAAQNMFYGDEKISEIFEETTVLMERVSGSRYIHLDEPKICCDILINSIFLKSDISKL